jgi:glycosyltransferase involved in cell wall biosynthesis
MNIVVLSDTASVNGGAAKIALDEVRALALAGHKVDLVAGVGPVSKELEGLANLSVHCMGEYDINTDPNRLRAIALGWWNPRMGRYVSELMESLNPEDTVVHVHSWTKALSSSPIRSVMDSGFEVVLTLHDFLVACPTGTLFLQQSQEKCQIKPMSGKCIRTNCDAHSYQQKLWRVGRKAIQTRFGRVPTGIRHFIYYSKMADDLLAPYLPENAIRHWLPNAIDMERKTPADVAQNIAFVAVGRLVPEKGVELLARAAAAEGVVCQFIGAGPASEAIQRANPTALLSGWMSHADSLRSLRKARALVFPSLWYETLGLVVLEAAGQGIPAIVPDTCAARESVIDGVTGLYFRSGDEADLRRKINMLRDPELATRMGRAAYERFWAPPGFSLELHRLRLEKIYHRILQSKVTPDAREAALDTQSC